MTLIYDLGLHDGSDTAHYLEEGAQVIAVDANPVMCAAAERQFSGEIADGRLTIRNIGIAAERGRLEFWVGDDHSEWSSFNRAVPSRGGARCHSITVDCVPIGDLLSEHGVPDYMKIDIEGNDRLVLAGLTPATAPRYISIEMAHEEEGAADLQQLHRLGYSGFKVICQNFAWRQVTARNALLYGLGPQHRIIRRVRREALRFSRRREGESGPWGERTAGPWRTYDHAATMRRRVADIDRRLGTKGVGWWFDVHARR